MINDELEDQEGTEGNDSSQQVNLDQRPSGVTQDRQELIDQALDEAAAGASEENVIDTLASKEGELTIEDLRKLPGAEGLTDEQIQAEWAEATKAKAEVTEEDKTFKLPFPVYDKDGNKIEALEKISVRDLFEGKIQLSYNAFGKEQRKTLAEALRNASMGHFNEQKYNLTLEERNRAATELAQANEKLKIWTERGQAWDAALTALSMGNIEPLKKAALDFQNELTKSPQNIPGMVPIDQVRQEQEIIAAGNAYIRDTIVPESMSIAQRYGADPKEVLGAVEFFIARDAQFLTKEKIESILQYEVPQLLEVNGYTVNGKAPITPSSQSGDIDELKKTVAALQSRIAETKNSQTESVRQKQKKAPPSGGGSTPGAGDSMPSFRTRAQFKAWSRGDDDWAKA